MDLKEAMHGYMMDSEIERQSVNGLKLKSHRLGNFVQWCETQGITGLGEVTPTLIKAYVLYVQSRTVKLPSGDERPFSAWTVRGHAKIVKAFFAWCQREGLLGGHDSPAARVPRIRLPQYVIQTFTPEQLDAMLQVCDTSTPLGYRDYAMFLTLMDTGIRVGELLALTTDNVFDGYLKVLGKGAKEREVGIGPTAGRALWKYIHVYRKPASSFERRVFLSVRGKPLDKGIVWDAIQRAGQEAGIEGVRLSPHTFRHTFAKSYLANGGDIFSLSRLLGHSDVKTTEIYLKDYRSSDARLHHNEFSPVERFRLGRRAPKRDTDVAG
jgi:site-specific recombinase XerD